MLDPFPFRNPPIVQELGQFIAKHTGLKTLPYHIHEVLFAALLYHFTMTMVSPRVSRWIVPQQYDSLSRKTRMNWDIHFVALIQSVLICALSYYILYYENERPLMGWRERVYGYTGGLGLVQAFTAGYFVWDLYICTRYFSLFGFGMLAHALSGLTVYSLGFRPFVNYYATSFVLYELSSPFLNIHWFCDKLGWTGGYLQLVNGVILLVTFAGCRLVWGTYTNYMLWSDVFAMVRNARAAPYTPPLGLSSFALNATTLFNNPVEALEVVKFAPLTPEVPTWFWLANLASSITTTVLNFYWYNQMIAAIRKRFPPPFGTKRKEKVESDVKVSRGTNDQGQKTLEVDAVELKRRQADRFKSSDSIHAA